MRKNLPVTQREIKMRKGGRLITTTDLKGVITYCNDEFVEISGFSRDELVGQAHNIIRHPDMPQAVFKNMWDYLKAGKAWMGVVKNRAKSGDHYWVSAYVTPIRENGQMVGYESVRVEPTREQIVRAERLYARISAGKSLAGFGSAIGSVAKSGWPFVVSLVASLVALCFDQTWLAASLVVLGHLFGATFILRSVRSRMSGLLALCSDAFRDPIVARTYSDETGGFAQLAMALLSEQARIRTALARIEDQAELLYDQARASHGYISDGASAIARQRAETDQTASAINEMTASIQEVAESVTSNAREAEEANRLAGVGSDRSAEALVAIEELVTRVNGIGATISKLGESTNSIGEAANLISEIAEQTNLLALNAAIEAARAGEHGRGFSVVADEVRQLAKRSAESADQIRTMIDGFVTESKASVEQMNKSRNRSTETVERINHATSALRTIETSVGKIHDQVTQIATASEQQSQVAEEINQNVVRIVDAAQRSDTGVNQTNEASHELARLGESLRELVGQFKV